MANGIYSHDGAILGIAAQTRDKSLLVGATTDNVPEGSSNLYFTAARARGVFSVAVPLVYTSGTGSLSIPVATSSANGYLSSTDWGIFNGKADAFTGYTGDVTVRDAAGTGTTTMTFSNGILTGVS